MELIIQLLKVAIGLALGAYFVWWSLGRVDGFAIETLWNVGFLITPP